MGCKSSKAAKPAAKAEEKAEDAQPGKEAPAEPLKQKSEKSVTVAAPEDEKSPDAKAEDVKDFVAPVASQVDPDKAGCSKASHGKAPLGFLRPGSAREGGGKGEDIGHVYYADLLSWAGGSARCGREQDLRRHAELLCLDVAWEFVPTTRCFCKGVAHLFCGCRMVNPRLGQPWGHGATGT